MRSRGSEQVGNQLRRHWNARLIFAILARVTVIRDHRGDAARRGALQRIDHQQQFHQVLVHRETGGLHHENVGSAHVLQNLQIDLTVFEAGELRLAARYLEERADLVRQRLIRRAGEDLELVIATSTLRPAVGLRLLPVALLLLVHLLCRSGCQSHSF